MGGAGVYDAYEQRGACYAACYIIKNRPLRCMLVLHSESLARAARRRFRHL